jgi:putative transposase
MPNHVHLVLAPETLEGLHRAVSEAHRRYTRHVNFREGWRGHLWQGRFASFVMDEPHLLTAMRYVELNPVRAGLVELPEAYSWSSARAHLWSSARAHLTGRDDALVQVEPMLSIVGDWASYLAVDVDEGESAALRRHEHTGRPLGDPHFIGRLENQLGRFLRKRKPGPKGPGKTN